MNETSNQERFAGVWRTFLDQTGLPDHEAAAILEQMLARYVGRNLGRPRYIAVDLMVKINPDGSQSCWREDPTRAESGAIMRNAVVNYISKNFVGDRYLICLFGKFMRAGASYLAERMPTRAYMGGWKTAWQITSADRAVKRVWSLESALLAAACPFDKQCRETHIFHTNRDEAKPLRYCQHFETFVSLTDQEIDVTFLNRTETEIIWED